jgi:hypothetical protein
VPWLTSAVMYLSSLSADQLADALEAADCLLGLPVRLDIELSIKVGTLRADLIAAIEDIIRAAPQTGNG